MIDDNLTTILVAGITVVSGAGFWSWMQKKSELAYARTEQQNNETVQFRETLKSQIDGLHEENRALRLKVEELLRDTADLKAELADAKATIRHLEQQLMMRQ